MTERAKMDVWMANPAVTAVAGATCTSFGRFVARAAVGAVLAISVAGCGTAESVSSARIEAAQTTPAAPQAASTKSKKTGGYYKLGKPYTVRGKTYYPKEDPDYSAEGVASWYGPRFHGGKTANGETFNMDSISAAHKTLPMPSYVRVTNLSNDRSIIVRVNNRGPFVGNRLIDLSHRTAELLGFAKNGVARVRVDYVGPASIDGSDHRQLAATLRTDGTLAQAPGAASAVQVAEAKPLVPDSAEVAVNPLVAESQNEVAEEAATPNEAVTQVASVDPTPMTSSGWSTGAEPVSGMAYAGQPGTETAR